MSTPAATPWEGLVEVGPRFRLRARLEGPPDRPLVVLLNGVMMTLEAWQPLVDELGDDVRLLRYDMRGQGGSDRPPGPLSIEQHAFDLLGLLGQLADRAAGGTHLVGLSSGVPVAVLAASVSRTNGRTPASLALLDGYLRMDAHLSAVMRAWIAAHEAGGAALRFDVATPWVWGTDFLQEQAELFARMRQASAGGDPAQVHALLSGVAAYQGDAGPDLAQMPDVPLLTLWGADDRMTPPHLLREFTRHAPWARSAVVEGAGHASPIERPRAVARELRSFWRETGQPEDRGGKA